MPRKSDMPCSICGAMMQCGRRSLPQGQATCHPCRRRAADAKRAKRPPPRLKVDRECQTCGMVFHQDVWSQVYCSPSCRAARRNWPKDKAATADERGYGKAHREERKRWKPIVESDQADCCLCGYHIEPGSLWHLDHTPDRTGYRGVAHPECNRLDGARRGNRGMPRPKVEKVCACGQRFLTIYPRQTYCSVECRPKHQSKPRVSPVQYGTCEECDRVFVVRHGRKFCTPTCGYAGNLNAKKKQHRAAVGTPLIAPPGTRSDSFKVTLACTECGAPSVGSPLRRYCTSRCRKRAARARARARGRVDPVCAA